MFQVTIFFMGLVDMYNINDTLNCGVINKFHVDLQSCKNILLNVITKDSKFYLVGAVSYIDILSRLMLQIL